MSEKYRLFAAADVVFPVIPFEPSQLDDLVLWYKADEGVTGDPSVTNWADQSSSGFDLDTVGGTNPQLVANEINALPVIRFASNGELFRSTGSPGPFASIAGLFCAIVFKTSGTLNDYLFSNSVNTGGNGYDFINNPADKIGSQLKTTSGFDTLTQTSPTIDDDTPRIVTSTYDGSNFKLFNGNTETATAAATGNTEAFFGEIIVGSFASSFTAFRWSGDIGEIVGCNANLSSEDRTSVWEYLADRWGITL